ncbi:MAG TPA: C45 family peptidase [Phycisphaerae bacterium]|nr:C45 family peptidase [Phycisphaerae bacterium]
MDVECVELRGSPREMGRQHGEQFAEPIKQFAQLRLEKCIADAAESGVTVTSEQVLDFCRSLLGVHEQYAPLVYEELCGIAEGAGVSLPALMMCNGLTDIRDAVVAQHGPSRRADVGGCSAWMVAPEATTDGHVLAGQTWDMHRSAQRYAVVFHRRPSDGPPTLGITTVGCLCLVGINEAGVAVGNNNLKPDDAGVGVMYLAMITHALAQTSLAAAVNAITLAPRCGGHNYYLAHADGTLVNIETTAKQFEIIDPTGGFYAHTNHYLVPTLQTRQKEEPSESTLWRLNRLEALLYEHAGRFDPPTMMRIMSDQAGQGDCNICRTDPSDEGPTCASIVMSPATGQIWATQGPPSAHRPVEFNLV